MKYIILFLSALIVIIFGAGAYYNRLSTENQYLREKVQNLKEKVLASEKNNELLSDSLTRTTSDLHRLEITSRELERQNNLYFDENENLHLENQALKSKLNEYKEISFADKNTIANLQKENSILQIDNKVFEMNYHEIDSINNLLEKQLNVFKDSLALKTSITNKNIPQEKNTKMSVFNMLFIYVGAVLFLIGFVNKKRLKGFLINLL